MLGESIMSWTPPDEAEQHRITAKAKEICGAFGPAVVHVEVRFMDPAEVFGGTSVMLFVNSSGVPDPSALAKEISNRLSSDPEVDHVLVGFDP